MCLLELTKADAMVLANVIRRTANENPFHWKESSVEKTRDLYGNVIAQLLKTMAKLADCIACSLIYHKGNKFEIDEEIAQFNERWQAEHYAWHHEGRLWVYEMSK